MTDRLNDYLRAEKVGQLCLGPVRDFVFQYDPEWLERDDAMPRSLQLPLQTDAFGEERARPFFSNLLPESELRRIIARKLGLSEQNDFSLLEAVGGECAGAVSLLPEDNQPVGTGSYRFLNDAELNALIEELPRRPMLAGEQGIRLSLAGAQNKLPVWFDGRQLGLPMGTAPSSHILKLPIPQYADSVANESFCMQLARRMGLPVPQVTVLNLQQPLYLVERYDREQMSEGQLERVHQEDFCQALGIPPDQKYEKEGGPGLHPCFGLLREMSIQPLADVQALLKWVIFNYLIGNADAHGKNISLLQTEAGPRLAPFYDLMSTAVYPEVAECLAMRIGGEDRPHWIIARRWQQFAEETGIGFKPVRQTLVNMKEQAVEEARNLAEAFPAEHGKSEIVEQIVALIEARNIKITGALAAVD